MSGVTKEEIAFLIFVLSFFALTIGEAVWLKRNGWAGLGKGLAFSFATNLFSLTVGSVVVFVIFGALLAMAWDGSMEKIPGGDYTIIPAMIFAGLFTPLLLTFSKRFLILILKMRRGKAAWIFSAASSILTLLVSMALPILFLYIF